MKFLSSATTLSFLIASALTASSALAANCTINVNNTTTGFPLTISTPNQYVCITEKISQNISATNSLIIIDADNVTLDLQGNELINASPIPAQEESANETKGVFVSGAHKNITVKNGRINGFNDGVWIKDYGSGYATNSLVENINVVNYTHSGIRADGTGLIKNNQINADNIGQIGIFSQSTGMSMVNNDIYYPVSLGISVGSPNSASPTNNAVIENNRFYGGSSSAIAIEVTDAHLIVVNNRIFNLGTLDLPSTCTASNNLVVQ